mmetsp:Transcript_10506/g.20163  ORF Transcript_10506/g.20163 Transcript_10506/m.20163 type:complete len:179 (-) Transcript_10506:240-776(-)
MTTSISQEGIRKLASELSQSSEYIPQITELREELKLQLCNLKNQIKQLELKKQNSRLNNEHLHQQSHVLKQKAICLRNDTWSVENKVKTLFRELEEVTSALDRRGTEVEHLKLEVKHEHEACQAIEELKAKITKELANMKKDRDMYKKKARSDARRVTQIQNRIENIKAANAHLEPSG